MVVFAQLASSESGTDDKVMKWSPSAKVSLDLLEQFVVSEHVQLDQLSICSARFSRGR